VTANVPTLLAALLLGFAASAHCLVMCGGISAALGIATARRADGKPRRDLLVACQLGRIASYVLAGLLLGGVLGGAIALLDIEAVRRTLRVVSAFALLFGALVAAGRLRDPGFGIGRRLWLRLAPLGRRLLPIASLPRAFAFGMVWGWMPCGFVYTVLLIAALQLDAVHGAATMLLFGLGTAPALLAAAFGAQRIARFGAHAGSRRAAAAVLLAGAVLTVAGPWLGASAPWLHGLLPFECTTAR
jgi:sulfite exporter TauE/SafE